MSGMDQPEQPRDGEEPHPGGKRDPFGQEQAKGAHRRQVTPKVVKIPVDLAVELALEFLSNWP